MKKNLSFLSKVGVTAASAALVAGIAWAELQPNPHANQTEVWTVPTAAIGADQTVTFVGFANNKVYQLPNDGSDIAEADAINDADLYKFSTAQKGTDTHTIGDQTYPILFVNGDNTSGQKRLRKDGTVVLNDAVEDVQWVSTWEGVENQSLVNISNGEKLYFDQTNKVFKTSTDNVHFTAYVKNYVYNTKFSDTGSTEGQEYTLGNKTYTTANKKVFNNGIIALRYDKTNSNVTNPKIQISLEGTEAQAGYIQWAITPSPGDPVVWHGNAGTAENNYKVQNLDIELSAIEALGTSNLNTLNTNIEIQTRYVVTNGAAGDILGYTTVQKQKYYIETYAATSVNDSFTGTVEGTFDTNGKFTITFSGGGNGAIKYMAKNESNVWENVAAINSNPRTITYDATDDVAKKQPNGDYVITLANYSRYRTYFCTPAQDWTITIHPNLSVDNQTAIFTGATAVATSNCAAGQSYVVSGNTVTISLTNTATETPMSAYSFQQSGVYDGTDGKKLMINFYKKGVSTPIQAEVTNYTADGTNYTVTVPAGITNTDQISIQFPQDAFKAVSGNNVYVGPASANYTCNFNNIYAGKTFTATPAYEYYTDADVVTATFNIVGPDATKPVNMLKAGTENTIVSDQTNSSVKFLDSNNNPVIGVTWTLAKSSDNTFTFTVTSHEGKLAEGNYMVSFPAGTLVDASTLTPITGVNTNSSNTNVLINVKKKANFTYKLSKDGQNPATVLCENDPLYLLVIPTAGTDVVSASIADPTKTVYADATHKTTAEISISQNAVKLADKVSDWFNGATIAGAALNVTVENGLFKANNNTNVAASSENVVSASVYKHLSYSLEKSSIDVDKNASTFTFNILDGTESTVADHLTTVDMISTNIKIGDTDTDNATITVVDGVATVTMIEQDATIPADQFTVTIPAKTFGNPSTTPVCTNESALVLTVNPADVTFAFSADATTVITTDDQSFTIVPSATLGTNAVSTIELQNSATVDIKQGDEVKKSGCTISGDATNGYIVNIGEKLPQGSYTVVVNQDAFKATGNCNTANAGTETFIINVYPKVSYSVVEDMYKAEAGINETVLNFEIKLDPTSTTATGTAQDLVPAIFQPANMATATPEDLAKTPSLVNGSDNIYPVITGGTAVAGKPGVYAYTATINQKIPAGVYYLTIPTGSVTAKAGKVTLNANAADLSVPFQAELKINFYGKEVSYAETENSFLLSMSAKNIEGTDVAAANINYVSENAKWILNGETYADEDITSKVSVSTTDATQITLDNSALNLAPGKYYITTTGNAYASNVSKGDIVKAAEGADVETAIVLNVVGDVTFEIADLTLSEVSDASQMSAPKFTLIVKQGGNAIVVDDNTDVTFGTGTNTFTYGETPTSVYTSVSSISKVADKNEYNFTVTTSEAMASAKSAYTLTIPAENLKATVSGVEFKNAQAIIVTVTVNKVFVFNVNVDGKSTLNSELPTTAQQNVTIKYAQTFAADRQAISLPFDVDYSVINEAGAEVRRINMIYENESGVGTWVLEELGANDKVYAYKPYLITYQKGKTLEFTATTNIKKVEASDVTNKITCASTRNSYEFNMVYESNQTDVDEYYWFAIAKTYTQADDQSLRFRVRNSTGALGWFNQTMASSDLYETPIWSWYAVSNAKGVNYSKFVNFEDFETTGITNVSLGNDSDAKCYNVAGQRVNNVGKNQIIIKNGKKYINK